VFFLGVSFPLVAPPEKRTEEKPSGDSDWDDARQEVYGQRQATMAGEPAEEYSQEKVDKLKEKLVETLKNATNIRGLKPEEFVTICVSGGASAGGGRFRMTKTPPGGLGQNLVTIDQPGSPSKRTIMTVRASKSEIDAFAKGKLTLEEFQKHAKVTTYTGDAMRGAADGVVVGGYSGRARFLGNGD
jgi:hypothetical protein